MFAISLSDVFGLLENPEKSERVLSPPNEDTLNTQNRYQSWRFYLQLALGIGMMLGPSWFYWFSELGTFIRNRPWDEEVFFMIVPAAIFLFGVFFAGKGLRMIFFANAHREIFLQQQNTPLRNIPGTLTLFRHGVRGKRVTQLNFISLEGFGTLKILGVHGSLEELDKFSPTETFIHRFFDVYVVPGNSKPYLIWSKNFCAWIDDR